jgi:hypothetical protein
MNEFLKRVFLFLVPVFLVSIIADYLISNKLKSSKKFGQREYPVWNEIFDGKIHADLLVMGSSRAWVHINPAFIKDSTGYVSYNIGLDGQKFPLQLSRYNILVSHNRAPKIIVYSLDMFMFIPEKGIYNKEQYLPYLMYNTALESALQPYRAFDYYDYRLPLVRYTGHTEELMHIIKITLFSKSNKNGRVNGFYGMEKTWNDDFDKVKTQMKRYTAVIDSSILASFDRFLEYCQKQQIKVVFVYSPEYHEGQNFVQNRNEMMTLFRKRSVQYNSPFLDYSEDSISYNKDYFYNVLHLNAKGADLFSKKLSSDLRKILIDKHEK